MIQYYIRNNKTGQITNGWNSDFADHTYYESSFGKPERWIIEASEAYDTSDVLETETREDISGLKTWVKLKAEYTIEITDVTFDHALQECIQNRIRAYPSPEEFLNAFFDGPEIALDLLRQRRYEVKAKYPKPTQG